MVLRSMRPSGFIEPCLPSRAAAPPSGPGWAHEIKHDGYRLMVRRDEAMSGRHAIRSLPTLPAGSAPAASPSMGRPWFAALMELRCSMPFIASGACQRPFCTLST
jgi:hypothetical protein